jgi:ABC-type nitrate/sulfonate/bicarbonate transport system substrate-binding protein
VLIASRATLIKRASDIRAAIDAIAEGVDQTLRHPEAAVSQIADVAGDEDRSLVRAQLRAVAPTWSRDLRLNRTVLERWATWAAQVGIVARRPDVGDAFVFGLQG